MAERSAAQIPNLLTLKTARDGRGRGRGERSLHSGTGTASIFKDKIVQQTDGDASVSRLSAVMTGYLQDAFAHSFVQGLPTKRLPIINRGTYIRTTAIDTLVTSFIETSPDVPKQILSLGAGTDTRYFRLASRYPSSRFVYHELDFAANTCAKVSMIKRSPEALKAIHTHSSVYDDAEIKISVDESTLHSSTYNLHAIDLRTIVSGSSERVTALPNLSYQVPTLIVSECCLVYLSPEAADGVLKCFTALFKPEASLGVVIYEPIRPYDSFGQVMIANLAQRGIVLQTLHKYASLAAQRQRLNAVGFHDNQRAADVDFLINHWIPDNEQERVSQCEMLDELEEWVLLAQHYCLAWGWREGTEHADFFSSAWKVLQGSPDDR